MGSGNGSGNGKSNLELTTLMDQKIQSITTQSLQDAKDGRWKHVAESFRELAYCCKRKGLFFEEFLEIRKELILAMETINPLAKTYVELEEQKKHGIIH